MAIMAAGNSQNNRNGNGRYVPVRKKSSAATAVCRMEIEELIPTLNAIDEKNIRTIFKQAKDPVELAFDHIDGQSFKKIAKDVVKDSISDLRGGIDGLKDAMADMKESLGDFIEFVGKIFTSNEEFTPEQI